MAATVCRYPPPGREDVDLTAAQHLSRLAQGVNLRSATPQQVAELSQALYDSGHVSLTDHALLSFQPAMGQGLPGQQGDTQAARDVIGFWQQQLAEHERQGDRGSATNDRRILNILENLNALVRG